MAKKQTTAAGFFVNAYHMGYKQAFGNWQLLPNGVLKGTTNNNQPMYRFSFGYSVYDTQAEDNALRQQIDVTVFGTRYDWLANNLGQYDKVMVKGDLKFSGRIHNNQAYVNADVSNATLELVSRYGNGGGNQQQQPQQQAQPQQNQQPPQQQNAQPPQNNAQPPQNNAQPPQQQNNAPAPQQQNNAAPQQDNDLPF